MKGIISGKNRVLSVKELDFVRREELKKRGIDHIQCFDWERAERVSKRRKEKIQTNIEKVFTPLIQRVYKEGADAVLEDVESEYLPAKIIAGGGGSGGFDASDRQVGSPYPPSCGYTKHDHATTLRMNASKIAREIPEAAPLVEQGEYQKAIDMALEKDLRKRIGQSMFYKTKRQETGDLTLEERKKCRMSIWSVIESVAANLPS